MSMKTYYRVLFATFIFAAIRPRSTWGTRHIIIGCCFLMTALNYSLRFTLSFGIVAMVKEPDLPQPESHSTSSIPEPMCPSLMSPHEHENNISASSSTNVREKKVGGGDGSSYYPTFSWDERDQGIVLSSFFWGYVVSQFPSGLLTQRYGGKWIIAFSMLITGLLSIALPPAAIFGGKICVMIVRILQGFFEGLFVPALMNILAKWTPPNERAKLVSFSFAGFPLGTGSTLLASGHIVTWLGWPFVFYLPGILAIILCILWILIVHNDPESHPRISEDERDYIVNSIFGSNDRPATGIEEATGNDTESAQKENKEGSAFHRVYKEVIVDIPWKEILSSGPVWVILVAQFCNAWGHNTLKSEGPKFLNSALHFDIHQNSYIASAPHFTQVFFSLFIGMLSDFFLDKKVVSMLTARKVCNTIGQWGSALAFAGIIISGCNRVPAVICYVMAGLINGATQSGMYVNIIDVSPKYAGMIEGIINSVANIAGFSAPFIAGQILYYMPSIQGWSYVFLLPVISNTIGNFVFLLGASAKAETWNNDK